VVEDRRAAADAMRGSGAANSIQCTRKLWEGGRGVREGRAVTRKQQEVPFPNERSVRDLTKASRESRESAANRLFLTAGTRPLPLG
jgi:hypothetical protein